MMITAGLRTTTRRQISLRSGRCWRANTEGVQQSQGGTATNSSVRVWRSWGVLGLGALNSKALPLCENSPNMLCFDTRFGAKQRCWRPRISQMGTIPVERSQGAQRAVSTEEGSLQHKGPGTKVLTPALATLSSHCNTAAETRSIERRKDL